MRKKNNILPRRSIHIQILLTVTSLVTLTNNTNGYSIIMTSSCLYSIKQTVKIRYTHIFGTQWKPNRAIMKI